MEFLIGLLGLVGPVIVGILTVPIFDKIKQLTMLKGKLPDWLQQMLVPVLAYGLSWFGALMNVALPASLELFTTDNVAALLAAALAMAIKAGQKADQVPA